MTPSELISATFILYHCASSATVPETSQKYTCGEGSHDIISRRARTDVNCEQIWTIEDSPIGIFLNGNVECHEPCSRVTLGQITVTHCDNLTLTVICLQEYLSEYRINFHGIISNVPPNTGKKRDHYGILASLALLITAVLGLIFQHYIPQCHGNRQTGVIQSTEIL
ncbi:uncharacterized protein LOC143474176 [Brachyhypopomus gauderio]|uniref:uncharacterized protein LOC143474176 n=1 Tax=Brachyhypopomus gauderio TaxID=698409 RepID=UPI0040421DF1